MFTNKKLVIFDMDGCLIDTETAYAQIWSELFDYHNIPISSEEVESWRGLGWEKIRERINTVTQSMERTLKLRSQREEIYHDFLLNNRIKLKPHAIEAIEYFKNKSYIVALGTSTFEKKAKQTLNHFNLIEKFEFIVYGDNVQETKPNPAIYNLILEKTNTTEEQAIIFEDSYYGIQAANNANIDVIYIPDGFPIDVSDLKIIRTIKTFEEIIK